MKLFRPLLCVVLLLLCVIKAYATIDPVSYSATGEIPRRVAPGKVFSSTYTLVSHIHKTMPTALMINKNFDAGFTSVDACNGLRLTYLQQCTVAVTFTASSLGNKRAQLTMNYAKNQVPLPPITVLVDTPISVTGTVSTPLPANTTIGQSYPVVFSFVNNDASRTAKGIVITPSYPAGFTQNSNACGTTLAPKASCQISGTYISQAGQADVDVTLSYNEGADVPLSTQTNGTTVTVVGTINSALPQNTVVGKTYPVVFSFTNTSSTTSATGVGITKSYPADFTQTADTCGAVLAADASCQISGTLTPGAIGAQTVGVTLSYAQGSDVPLSTNTNVTTLVITGAVDTELPEHTEVGESYPVVFSFTNTNTVSSATGISLLMNYPSGFAPISNSCSNSLAPSSSCQVTGIYTPTALGPAVIAVNLSYAEGDPVDLITSTTVTGSVAVNGSVTVPLPANTNVSDAYPVVFSFTNLSDTLSATGINVAKNYPAAFTQDTNNCTLPLAAKSSCQISGTFRPTATGPDAVGVIFTYLEGSDVPLSTETTVSALSVDGEVTKALPANAGVGEVYPVSFVFRNTSTTTAVNSFTIIKNYPAGFVEDINSCTPPLAASTSCYITGRFIAAATGPVVIGVTFSYPQGQDIVLSTDTTVSSVEISGTVDQALPVNTTVSNSYPVVFTYSNLSASSPASGIVVQTNYPTGFTQRTDTCGSTLGPLASCQIRGDFVPAAAGPATVGVVLDYNQGSQVGLDTSTTAVANVAVVGDVLESLPVNTAVGSTYPFIFSFSNTGSSDATGVKTTDNFTPTSDTCGVTILAGQSCQIEGSFTPAQAGVSTFHVTLSYAQGGDVKLSTHTTSTNVVVTGDVDPSLPANTAIGPTYPITFTFSNTNHLLAATGLHFIKNFPTEFLSTTDTCSGLSSLPVLSSCQVIGTFTPATPGPISVGVTLDYDEGNDVPLSTDTNVVSVTVLGTVPTPLPDTTIIGSAYSVVFRFKNQSTLLPATSVVITTNYPAGFNQTSNSCGVSLGASASCEIQGTLTPAAAGLDIVSVNFSYAEGADIKLETKTTAINPIDTIKLIAVGDLGFIMTTPNSGGWTRAQISNQDLKGVVWAGPLSMWVIVGANGVIYTSPNGVGWTLRTSNTVQVMNGVAWNGALFVAVGGDASGIVVTSADGINWSAPNSVAPVPLNTVTYSSFLGLFVAAGGVGNSNALYTSTDGVTWVQRSVPVSSAIFRVIWNPDRNEFVAVGGNQATYLNGFILTSADGVNWTQQTIPTTSPIMSIAWGGFSGTYVAGEFVAYPTKILTSPDGVQWQEVNVLPNGRVPFSAIIGSDQFNKFIAAISGAAPSPQVLGIMILSANGTNWQGGNISGVLYSQVKNIGERVVP